MRLVRSGGKEAFAVLVGRHRRLAANLVSHVLGGGDLVNDPLQEATVAALVGLDQLRSPERLGSWYAGFALNVSRRMLRERSRLASLILWSEGPVARPDEQAEAADLSLVVRRAVAGLPPGQRSAVLAFYWRGLTHAQAAAELSTSPGAVKARLHAARTALAPALRSRMEDEEVQEVLADGEPTWVQVEVAEIRRGTTEEGPARHAAVLRERGGERRLAIWMGQPEAVAVASSLESYETPRPMTFRFGAGLLRASRPTVAKVRITRLADSAFYALVLLDGPAGPGEVDARPSEALNLALVVNAPIRIDALLLDDADVVGSSEWKQYPTHAAELVAELDEHHRRDRAVLRAALQARDTGSEAGS